MAVPISNVTRRVVFTASGTGPYSFTFEILANTDIAVYKDDTLLTLTTDYTVTINSNGTGSITLTASPTGATQIAIVGNRTIQRTTDFVTGGDFFANTVNNEMDQQTIFAQQNAEGLQRALQAPQTDPTSINMVLPRAADRAGKYLAFDEDGNPEPGPTSSDVDVVSGISDEVVIVAGISANVTTVAGNNTRVTTVANNISNVNTVAGISANVTTVAGISSNVTSVAGNSTNINTVATNIANVNAVGSNIANVNAVNSNSTNINAVNSNKTNIDTVAGISANVTTVAGISANVTSVANNETSIDTVATEIGDVITAATNITAIQNASSNATAAAASAAAASASAAAASAVALGNEPVRHSVRPSLLLDFANTKQLDPRITFTRASTADYYDGQTVAKAEENLLTYSQDFDNSAWVKSESTVTANSVAAPDGTTTADTIKPSTNTARHTFIQNFTSVGATYVWSIYAKPNGYNRITIRESQSSGNGATFDVSTGTVVVNTVSGVGSITSVGNGWYRCSMVATETSGTRSMQVLVNTNAGSGYESAFAGDGTSGVYIWGAQVEQRSTVTAYTPTTTQAITNYIPAMRTAAPGVARFDHDPTTGESLGLLIEESRTNLANYSEQLENWSQINGSTSTNTIVAPDGTLTGDLFIPNSTSGQHRIESTPSITSGTAYTFSVYVKYAGYRFVGLRAANDTGNIWFDIINGTVYSTQVGSGTITSVGNGWYRCTATGTATATGAAAVRINASTTSGTGSYSGDGFSGLYVWGAQLEAGSFSTSYIPTVASQVTRAADVASMTGTNFSSWYRTDEGTMYAETVSPNPTTGQYHFSIDVSSATRISMYTNAGAGILFIRDSSTTQASISVGTVVANTPFKMAAVYKVNDFQAAGSGSLGTADTTGVVPVLSAGAAFFGNYISTSTSALNGTIKKISYYPKRLTNAELQGLTTV